MSSAPIFPPSGQDNDDYAIGCEQQWAREDSVINGVTAASGRPRSQRIRARRRAGVVSPKFWEKNAAAEEIAEVQNTAAEDQFRHGTYCDICTRRKGCKQVKNAQGYSYICRTCWSRR